ncbi:synaptotagmin-7 isoform X3 [Pimephales promelas]|uniref:synaptotagmin-7 isoform X3 n=1 Tax=Pimephales promelas TaxID=90988 RepID=UPI001955E99B|nr:synaptotagmin-7 isoform X3 [Pimephales promelas]
MSRAFKNCSNLMVTGASRGLGLQIVESLVTGGFSPGKIIATARDPDGAKELQRLADEYQNIHIIKLDVISQESIERAASEVEQLVQEEGLNCLINNAGINVVANLETVTADKMLENFHTNSVAPLMITKAMLPLLKRAAAKGTGMGIHRAAVINMTSLLGSVELYWGDRANTFKWYPYRTSKSCTWKTDMVFFPTLILSFGEIQLLFSEEVEYSILSISAVLFLIAFCLLTWLIYRYCARFPVLQTADGPSAKSGGFQYATQTQNSKTEVHYEELSHRVSPGTSCTNLGSSLDQDSMAAILDVEEDHIQGSLRFSLFYDQLQSRLVVTVLDAQDLAVRDFSHSVDPFVWVRLIWAESEDEEQCPLHSVLDEWQTRLVKKSSCPVFGDQFSCSLAEEEVSRVTVRFEVRDFDKYSRHGILGEARVPLNSLKMSYPLELRQDLQVPKKDMVGEALLSLKYLPTSQRLEVGVLKIRTVCHSNKTERAIYARISIICNQCKLRHQRTTQKMCWEVTVFNEVLTFVLPDQHIRECSIIVSVFELQPSKKSSKRLIGNIHLKKDKSSENEHWKLMMQSLRQPIAKWHLILI